MDLLAGAIQTYVSELDICIPENEVADADRLGEDAVSHYKGDVEAIRDEITGLAVPALPSHKPAAESKSISPVKAAPPQLSAM